MNYRVHIVKAIFFFLFGLVFSNYNCSAQHQPEYSARNYEYNFEPKEGSIIIHNNSSVVMPYYVKYPDGEYHNPDYLQPYQNAEYKIEGVLVSDFWGDRYVGAMYIKVYTSQSFYVQYYLTTGNSYQITWNNNREIWDVFLYK